MPEPKLDLFVLCHAHDLCRKNYRRIRLLLPNPLPRDAAQGLWPSDDQRLFLECPECRRVSVYGQGDAGPSIFPDRENMVWISISFRCEVEGCNTPIEFHVLRDPIAPAETEIELRARLESGWWRGASPCGHPIATTNGNDAVIQWVSGRMQGYNPEDSRWKNF